MRYISLPAVSKRVSLCEYIRGVRLAKANPDVEFKYGLTCWWPCTGCDIVRQFMEGVHDRINQRGGIVIGDEPDGYARMRTHQIRAGRRSR